MPVALITGASRGLGEALAEELAKRAWDLVIDARGRDALARVATRLGARVTMLAGDVADPEHRRDLVRAVERHGRLDVLVNNASTLGPTPLKRLERLALPELERVLRVNVVAPLGLIQEVLPQLRATSGVVVNVTSDAAVEAYPGWGGYGASKAALEQLAQVLAVERPDLRVYVVDPGDMRTRMHTEAEPDLDPATLPPPEDSVPGLVRLLAGDLPSGRYRTRDLAPTAAGAA
jgi:NAD(P)-dependent dehydrogenase (short-subunit alcohol dehydrogenase family)